jgi:hypothetical protein
MAVFSNRSHGAFAYPRTNSCRDRLLFKELFRSSTPSTESAEVVEAIAAPSKIREDSAEDLAQGVEQKYGKIEEQNQVKPLKLKMMNGVWRPVHEESGGGLDGVMANAERRCHVMYLE